LATLACFGCRTNHPPKAQPAEFQSQSPSTEPVRLLCRVVAGPGGKERAIYFLNNIELGSGEPGFARVLENLERLAPGTELKIRVINSWIADSNDPEYLIPFLKYDERLINRFHHLHKSGAISWSRQIPIEFEIEK
jgi:hypothetical protein